MLDRKDWPYPALLPHSIKAYPIVQIAKEVGPQDFRTWPLEMAPSLLQWRAQMAGQGSSEGNQLYLHVPFCPFLCHFCPLYKVEDSRHRTPDTRKRFVNTIIREIQLYSRNPDLKNVRFNTIYFGGGTPTELTPEQLGQILTALRSSFNVDSEAEITLEGVARQMLAPDYLSECFGRGFNRISFGVQTTDPNLRQRIGRGDSVEDYERVFELTRKLAPHVPVNVEIMAGLPEQTSESFENDLSRLVAWEPNSIDILYYVMMPGTALHRLANLKKSATPVCGPDILSKRIMANSRLESAGYSQITGEVFVRDDRDLFVRTSFGGGGGALNTVLALGPSAFGSVHGVVYHNVCDLAKYIKTVEQSLLPVHTATKLNLRTARRRAMLFSVLRLSIPDSLVDSMFTRRLVRRWEDAGLVQRGTNSYDLTRLGKLWYNHMQMDLLPVSDALKTVRMFGTPDQLIDATKHETQAGSQFGELLLHIRSGAGYGFARAAAFQAYLRLLNAFMSGRRAVGFTGYVDAP